MLKDSTSGAVVVFALFRATGGSYHLLGVAASIHAGAHEVHAVTQIERVVLQQASGFWEGLVY